MCGIETVVYFVKKKGGRVCPGRNRTFFSPSLTTYPCMITGADEKNGVFTSGRKMHNPVLVAKVQPYFLKHTPAGFAIMIHTTTGNGKQPVIKSNSARHRFSNYLIIRSLLMRGERGIMLIKNVAIFVCLLMIFGLINCSKSTSQVVELKSFPIDNLEGIITQSGVEIDKTVSSDGKGSLRITVSEPTVVRLYEVRDLNIENARLIYQAKVRTEGVEGQVYLEMWCHFSGRGEFFSRGLQSTLTGTNNWVTMETPFFLKKGEKPDYVKLNLVINGKGTAWIDDIRLIQSQLMS